MGGTSCHRCGAAPAADALDWSTTSGDGVVAHLCGRCTRRHVRDIEGKLDEQWWTSDQSVLVIEDDDDTRLLIRMSLEMAGYVVDEAITGEEAVLFLEAGHRPATIVADVGLPGSLDGWDVRERVRTLDDTMPVIMISAEWREGDSDPRRADVSFLAKPFDMDDLVDLVDRRSADQAGAGRA